MASSRSGWWSAPGSCGWATAWTKPPTWDPSSTGRRWKAILQYIEAGQMEGAQLLCGGHRLDKGDYAHGWFIEPTVFGDVQPKCALRRRRSSVPWWDDSLRQSGTGDSDRERRVLRTLCVAVHARREPGLFRHAGPECGITYINAPTIGAEVHLPFGGTKATGNGHREGGVGAIDFYTDWKTLYIDYSDRLQRAQIDRPD